MDSREQGKAIRLVVQTPARTVLDEDVLAICAEDSTGRFGIRPACEPLVAALAPGLLSYRNSDGAERFVAVGQGLLDAQRTVTRVAVREAYLCGSLDEVEEAVARASTAQYEEEASLKGIFRHVYDHLLAAVIDEGREP